MQVEIWMQICIERKVKKVKFKRKHFPAAWIPHRETTRKNSVGKLIIQM